MNNIGYRMIIWDLDGTLLDTSIGLLESARYLINTYGLEMPDEDTFRSIAGPRIQDSLKRIYDLDERTIKRLSDAYRDNYKSENLLKAELYEGIPDVLENFRKAGIKQTVATNKRQDLAEMILDKFGLTEYMDHVCGTDFGGKYTKVDLLNRCMELCGVKKDSTILLGDSDYDAKSAADIGIDFAAVMYGFGFKDEKDIGGYPFRFRIDKPIDIINVIVRGE